ncbi:DUF2796 domain-containing protein [Natronobiforma cellulositropha]|uniref:DUF2796 domain-containing protein n=1 Tax=Natronobiforma cellulositropha TaxID=1679076 RepID=UPI0021D5BF99|nr:DUF2796 domain-containing protein [Natronobiforma cellulositropha]
MDLGLVALVVAIGFVHGVLPDHGWPIAAMYALGRSHRWLAGVTAGLILGVGHLVSSVALVLAYFWVSGFAAFAKGPWLRYVAGTMLILLGIHEYRHGGHAGLDGHDHTHHTDGGDDHGGDDHAHHEGHGDDHGHAHDHSHGEHVHGEHTHDHGEHTDGVLSRLRDALPGGGHQHLEEAHAQRGLFALGATALLLGFAHEEPIQILAICVGTAYCLELMLVYSLAVIVAILLPTLLLIAGYERHRETIERYTPYLPTITAVVLVGMGLAFITGVF